MMPGLSKRVWKWAAGILAVLLLSFGAYAAVSAAEKASRTAQPAIVIDKSKSGDKCVEETSFMRKNHMKLLMHQRDETMHKGIRTEKHSLKNCIACHASTKDNNVLGSDQHFCQGCHTYAAVNLDCWECHTSKAKQAQPSKTPDVAANAPAPAAKVGADIK